ncbi:MAG: response regulator [Candidatus Promineifilaceae bacterium]
MSDFDRQIRRLQRRAERERTARKSAEKLLEDKSRELYEANQKLEATRADLERLVEVRTGDLKRRAEFTQTLFRATANTSLPINEQLNGALLLATDALGLEHGVVSRIIDQRYFVQNFCLHPDANPDLNPAPIPYTAIDLDSTLSQFVLQKEGVLAIDKISESEWQAISGIGSTPTEAYIGTPIHVHGDVYGTLAFAAPHPYNPPFDQAAKDFVTLMARWVGSALERQQAEKTLDERQDELRLLSYVASKTDNIVVITDSGGYIEWVNESFTALTGYSRLEVLGGRPGELLQGPETDPETIAYMRACLDEQKGFNCELLNYGKDGTPYWVSIEVQPVHDDSGTLTNFIAIERDISERRQVLAALQQAKQDAEEANVAKSQFLANMSHEIRTPMNAIIGMAGLLMDTTLSAEQAEFASTIRVAGENLLTIINEILDFSKIEAGKMELEEVAFDIRQCVEDALDLVATTAGEKRLDLAYFIEQDTPATILSDATRLRQVLVNLLSNALKFTETGEVVVTVKPEALGDNNWRLAFTVRDTGIGIPAHRASQLFQAFTQVDASTTRRYGGTGLGLVICKRICQLMGGDIWVESEVGLGSKFIFDIVVKATDSSKVPVLPEQFELSNRRMLIVDDNTTNRLILRRYAQSWGMVCEEADNATNALGLLTNPNRFDVAVLDVHMPEVDGIELTNLIKRDPKIKNLPIIILSSTGRAELASRTLDVIAYLNKPLKPSQLLNALATVFTEQPQLRKVSQDPEATEYDRDFAIRHPLQILLAEDNRVNQLVATRMLSRLGYRVDVAGNGLEVLAALERQRYDVVLMDVQMPEMDGIETTKQIQASYSAENRPHIIALTANALQGDRERYLAVGMNDYMSKPIRVHELTQSLANAPVSVQTPILTSVIDFSIAEDQFGEDAEMMMEMLVPMFVEDSTQQLTQLSNALAAADLKTSYHVAHTIKGSAASLGATQLAEVAGNLENAGRQGHLHEAHAYFAKLQVAFQAATNDEQFKKWL